MAARRRKVAPVESAAIQPVLQSPLLDAAEQLGLERAKGRCRLPQRLRARWAIAREDPEYLSAQDSLATLEVLRQEYEARLPEGDSPVWRRRLVKSLDALLDLIQSGCSYEECTTACKEILASCNERVREDEIIKEITGLALALNTIKSVELRRVEKGAMTLTVQESLSLLNECGDIIDAVATDPIKKAWGMRRLSALINRKATGGTISSPRVSMGGSVQDDEEFIPRAAEPEG